jgi:nucleotide-binding universal stress UspA family protein
MYRKILVPLDGSDFSECSLSHVKAIATGCRVPEVVIMRVIEKLPETGWISNAEQEIADKSAHDHAIKYLSETAEQLKSAGLFTTIAVVDGQPAHEIMEYADKNNVDLIIISTHGSSGIARWAFGSVADKVVRHSKVPVLIASPAACRIS